ncbi:MAG: hypothetical protein ACJ760_08070 [Thermoleophilaceae bacterium]
MAYAGVPSTPGLGPARAGLDGLEAGVRALDPATRALLDLSLRRRLRDDDMAPILRIDSFNLAWRRARAIERLASDLGLDEPSGLAQVRAALPYLPERAWLVPAALPPGDDVVEGEAVTMEFDAIAAPLLGAMPLARPVERPLPARPPEPAVPVPRLSDAVRAAVARPGTGRGALIAAGGALVGALLSRRRR